MLRKGLATEIRWFMVYFLAIVFVGISFGYGREAAIFALGTHIIWMYKNLGRLESWVMRVRRYKTKDNTLFGLWGEIADDIKLLAKRYKKDKSRLQAVVQRAQQMASALHDGVVLTDRGANVEWWNQAAGETLNLRKMDIGHRITNILRDPRFQSYFDAKDYGEPLEIESYRNEGQKLLFQIHPFGQGERLIIIRDVTHIAKLERMRRDFVANVSHELRTPLTVVRGYVETLLDMPDQPPVLNRALQQMQQQGLRMTSLVNDLITLTKLETDERNAQTDLVNLNALTNLIINDANALKSDNISLTNDVDSSLVMRGCEKELRSAISNLVLNAVKYCAGDTGKDCTVRIYSDTQGGLLSLHIADNGVGIDSKHIPRLTERFYRIDGGRSSSAGGTGLGLAIVKHVLIRHDALLRVSSKLGKGSTFTCSFPTQRLIHTVKSP